MKFTSVVTTTALLTGILAIPRGRESGLARRLAARAGSLAQPYTSPLIEPDTLSAQDLSVTYSRNWAGAVHLEPPNGTTFTSISGVFKVPTPKLPPNNTPNTAYSASIWAGIDGNTYRTAILQAGIDITVSDDAEAVYSAWYEWYPDYARTFSETQFTFKVGDLINLTMATTSPSAGSVTLHNLSTGKKIVQPVKAPSAAKVLGGQNAEWIVEDFKRAGELVPFADFGRVVFDNCSVGTADGKFLDTTEARLWDIRESVAGKILTNSSLESASRLVVTYNR